MIPLFPPMQTSYLEAPLHKRCKSEIDITKQRYSSERLYGYFSVSSVRRRLCQFFALISIPRLRKIHSAVVFEMVEFRD